MNKAAAIIVDRFEDGSGKQDSLSRYCGENGAGKTTLMKALYGMVIPGSGTIRVHDQAVVIRRTIDAMHYNIGMGYQHFMLVENMKVYENIEIGFEDKRGYSLIRMQ